MLLSVCAQGCIAFRVCLSFYFVSDKGPLCLFCSCHSRHLSFPQVYYQHGGKEVVLFGSGGESQGGSLWAVTMADLLQGDNSKVLINSHASVLLCGQCLIGVLDR